MANGKIYQILGITVRAWKEMKCVTKRPESAIRTLYCGNIKSSKALKRETPSVSKFLGRIEETGEELNKRRDIRNHLKVA